LSFALNRRYCFKGFRESPSSIWLKAGQSVKKRFGRPFLRKSQLTLWHAAVSWMNLF